MIIIYKIPGEFTDALARVQAYVPQALLAGGCLRDTINDVPVNDIDIFVPAGQELLAGHLLSDTHPTLGKSIPEPYFTHNDDVRSVQYYEGVGYKPVNIIGVTHGTCTVEKQLSRFDFGICRIAYDGERLWKDLSFDRDMADKTFTLTSEFQTPEQLAYSLGRFERLSGKYPGWKLVRPAPLAPFDFDNI
jgi:tRNA nucleotidyltransferase/poly(A) polymerase